MPSGIQSLPITGIPRIRPGDDLASLIAEAAQACGVSLEVDDIVVVAQKVISKAEGALVDLREVEPGPEAERVAAATGKDPRLVEVILGQATRIVRVAKGVLIVETQHGLVCANGGIDHSNVEGDEVVTLLPVDPDASARHIRDGLSAACGVSIAVIVSDTFNRPWREGSINVAIGVAGMNPLTDQRGEADDTGQTLRATVVSLADEVASAAQIVMGETGGVPVAVVRGIEFERSDAGAAALLRASSRDLFR